MKRSLFFVLLSLFTTGLTKGQTVDKLRLGFEESQVTSKQIGMTVSNDGKLAAFAYENKKIKIVDFVSGRTITKLDLNYTSLFELRFTASNKKIVVAHDNNKVSIIDIESGKTTEELTVTNTITKFNVSQNKEIFAVGQDNSLLTIYDIATKKRTDIKSTKHHICAIAFHPNENTVAIAKTNSSKSIFASDKGNVELYDILTGKKLKSIGNGKFSALSYNEDGSKLFMCGVKKLPIPLLIPMKILLFWYTPKFRNIVQEYDTKTGKSTALITRAHKGGTSEYSSMLITKNGKALCSRQGNSFDVYDLKTNKTLYTTENDQFSINMNFSKFGIGINRIYSLHDGKNFLINSFDNNICQIYNIEQNSIIAYVYSDANSDFVIVGRDGRLDGEQNAISKLYWSEKKSNKKIPIESTFNQFYTPSLLAKILNNEKLESIKVDINNLLPQAELKIVSPSVNQTDFRGMSLFKAESNNADVMLEFNATDKGGGIQDLRVYQNGKLIFNSAETINELEKTITKSIELKLTNGENHIKVTAVNKEKTESSQEFIYNYTGKNLEPSKLFVFAIGINNYEKSTYNLNFAVPDADGFIEAVEQSSKGIFTSVNVVKVTNENATKAKIKSEIDKLKVNIGQNDVFIFYYAGHGTMVTPKGEEKAVFHLVPHDVTNLYSNEIVSEKGISTFEIQTFSKEIKAQKQLFIIDACQSGGAVEGLASTRGAINEKEMATLARSTGTYFLTASASDQLAGEFAALGHGVFTYSILQALTGKADGAGDQKVSVKELSLYVENSVPVLSEKFKNQKQYPVSYGYGQDFPIALCNTYKLKELDGKNIGKYSSYTIEELMKMKREAVEKEDYELAKELKQEIDNRTK